MGLKILSIFLVLSVHSGFQVNLKSLEIHRKNENLIKHDHLVVKYPQLPSASSRVRIMRRQLFLIPQIGFVAACVTAIVTYVYFHIDEIREKQRTVIESTMNEQSVNVRNAQDTQKKAIENAKRQQALNIERARLVTEEARRRAEDLKPK